MRETKVTNPLLMWEQGQRAGRSMILAKEKMMLRVLGRHLQTSEEIAIKQMPKVANGINLKLLYADSSVLCISRLSRLRTLCLSLFQ